jgi:hypothetical protein
LPVGQVVKFEFAIVTREKGARFGCGQFHQGATDWGTGYGVNDRASDRVGPCIGWGDCIGAIWSLVLKRGGG